MGLWPRRSQGGECDETDVALKERTRAVGILSFGVPMIFVTWYFGSRYS